VFNRYCDLWQRELEPAIAGQAHNRAFWFGDLRANGRRRTKSKRAIAGGGIKPAAGAVVVIIEVCGIDRLGRIADDESAG
jgi:hypothetical protein